MANSKTMFNPPHPGETIRDDILPELGLNVTQAARQLGISRVARTRMLHGHAAISIDMARRLEKWLGGPKRGPSADSWLKLQMQYDLWHARQTPEPNVQPAMAPRI